MFSLLRRFLKVYRYLSFIWNKEIKLKKIIITKVNKTNSKNTFFLNMTYKYA